jgi:hypothetical protein
MADVANIITLGIGPSSDLTHLLTSGLGMGIVADEPTPADISGGGFKFPVGSYRRPAYTMPQRPVWQRRERI